MPFVTITKSIMAEAISYENIFNDPMIPQETPSGVMPFVTITKSIMAEAISYENTFDDPMIP